MGNPSGQSAALNNLGATYFSLGQYEAAHKSYEQAIAIYRVSGNRQAEAETLANLSLLACVQENLEEGRVIAHKAIELSEQSGDKVNQANALYYLGRIELADGRFDTAEKALQQALNLRREIPHHGRLAEIQIELAWLYHRQHKTALALEQLSAVVEILSEGHERLDGTDNPYRIYALAASMLKAQRDPRASATRKQGNALLRERAEKIRTPALRSRFEEVHDYQTLGHK